jgi:hypothetical protein
MKHEKCNCCDCIWDRVVLNSGKIIISTKQGKRLKYLVYGERISWEPLEPTMNKLYPIHNRDICDCIEAREKDLNVSEFPGVAQSYKWALLNDKNIWL